MIAQEFRFASARRRVKELIEEGYLGPLQLVVLRLLLGPRRTRRPTPFSADRDIAAAFAGAADGFVATLHLVDGGRATMIASTSVPFGPGTTIEIYGRDGTLATPQTGLNPPGHGTLLGAKIGEEGLAKIPILERLEPFADTRDDRLMPFRLLVREFVQGINNEGKSPAPNFYGGLRCQ